MGVAPRLLRAAGGRPGDRPGCPVPDLARVTVNRRGRLVGESPVGGIRLRGSSGGLTDPDDVPGWPQSGAGGGSLTEGRGGRGRFAAVVMLAGIAGWLWPIGFGGR